MKVFLCLTALLLVGCTPKHSRSMQSLPSLKVLLDELSAIEVDHPEVSDSMSRDFHYRPALEAGFIQPIPGYRVPADLGMNSPEANALVRTALQRFFDHASNEAKAMGLTTPQQRLEAFEDGRVRSKPLQGEGKYGRSYDDFFGSSK